MSQNEETYMLEINLISAQGVKVKKGQKSHTYAIVWVDDSNKLRTRIDEDGGENPTWNDKFVFRVPPEFLSSDTAAVNVQIYSIAYFRDNLIGTVRFLISNLYPSGSASSAAEAAAYLRSPSATALQIRRPSGSFRGVLNIGAMVVDNNEFGAMSGMSAMGYQDLMGESFHRHGFNKRTRRKTMSSIKEDFSGNTTDDEGSERSCASTPTGSSSSQHVDMDDVARSSASSPPTMHRQYKSRSYSNLFNLIKRS